MFNAIIEQVGLRELDLNGRNYAWINGRCWKNLILYLEQEGVIEGEEVLMKYITSFYKELIGHITLKKDGARKNSSEEAAYLVQPFN